MCMRQSVESYFHRPENRPCRTGHLGADAFRRPCPARHWEASTLHVARPLSQLWYYGTRIAGSCQEEMGKRSKKSHEVWNYVQNKTAGNARGCVLSFRKCRMISFLPPKMQCIYIYPVEERSFQWWCAGKQLQKQMVRAGCSGYNVTMMSRIPAGK